MNNPNRPKPVYEQPNLFDGDSVVLQKPPKTARSRQWRPPTPAQRALGKARIAEIRRELLSSQSAKKDDDQEPA